MPTIRHPLSNDVADHIRAGAKVFDAIHYVIGGIRDGSAPRTSDILADLETMGLWKPRPKTKAYDVTIRRLANGCDFHFRLFAVDRCTAADRAMHRARLACHIPLARYKELHAKGIAVFRTVSCQLSADQSRPIA